MEKMEQFQKDEVRNHYIAYLLDHMTQKGMSVEMVMGLIREVSRIVFNTYYVSSELVNKKLEYLGWGKDVLDEKGLQLILLFLEDHGFIKVQWEVLN
ncbi:MAG: hypothetical protein KCCBMMGE_01116 [Candidatus Methanoperedenaceae archaeon GB37]|nr:MAG: hypothetical protein KCCBMMGE_01116 [Candidatus Methanoperedenaceae archaeon GB37]CAD7781594.1 hypothetical protein DMNBHIDG_02686 [Candidatus Methanoperedenaceae archaeon GB37]